VSPLAQGPIGSNRSNRLKAGPECRTYWQYKKHSKENSAAIICDILNHSQENFVIEIKPISWFCPDPIFFKNKYPNPILIRKNRTYPAGYLILILSMLTSAGYFIIKLQNHWCSSSHSSKVHVAWDVLSLKVTAGSRAAGNIAVYRDKLDK